MSLSRQLFKNLASKFVNETFSDFSKAFEIQQLTETPDGLGGFTVSWVKFADAVGFVSVVSGGELVESNEGIRIGTNYMTRFSMQYIAGIVEQMRILYNGETYNIKNVKAVQDVDVWLIIEAEKTEAT
jgi:SPP1 family predicted phage head-tail adaptor